jgi:hypothetical protein
MYKYISGLLLAISVALASVLMYRTYFFETKVQKTQSNNGLIVMRTPGGLLDVSTVTAEERFETNTRHTILGVPVGKTVAIISVPAVYRYHISLAKEWSIRMGADGLVVIAPAVQPSLPVAINTAKLQAFSGGLWAPFVGQAVINALQRSITATLGARAASEQLITLQREAARTTVSEFVQNWVVNQPRWKGVKPPVVYVFFEDESLGKKAAPFLLMKGEK